MRRIGADERRCEEVLDAAEQPDVRALPARQAQRARRRTPRRADRLPGAVPPTDHDLRVAVVEIRDAGEIRSLRGLVGFTGLWLFRDQPELELLYGVDEQLWGQGYAPEIAQAVIGYCFATLGMPSVRASTDAPNTASIRVLEKLGLEFAGRGLVGALDTVFYEVRRR